MLIFQDERDCVNLPVLPVVDTIEIMNIVQSMRGTILWLLNALFGCMLFDNLLFFVSISEIVQLHNKHLVFVVGMNAQLWAISRA